jgi:hypothetical protein
VLACIAAIATIAAGVVHLVLAAMTQAGMSVATATPTLTELDRIGVPVGMLVLLQPFVYLLATLAACRSGLLPKASIVLGVLFVVAMVVGQGPIEWVSLALGLAWKGDRPTCPVGQPPARTPRYGTQLAKPPSRTATGRTAGV